MTTARRLAAILAIDVVGYSRPMGAGTAKAVLAAFPSARAKIVSPARGANRTCASAAG
jgi:hypothetical protein